MSNQKWIVGEKQRLEATFTPAAVSGDPQQPVRVSIRQPDGELAVDDVTATESTARIFYYDFTPTAQGFHEAKFQSADGAIEIFSFYVNRDTV